jgi:hypothetical protein
MQICKHNMGRSNKTWVKYRQGNETDRTRQKDA